MNIADLLPHTLQQLHFIRPYWLLLIFPALLMAYFLLRREKNNNSWKQHIDPVLLTPLLQGQINTPGKKLPVLAALFWTLCAIALAGPTWEKLPRPVEKRDNALVILMDLSPSMLAGDVLPSRLVAAQHKILDLLQLRKEGYTALICYSGDAHVVSPLTDDTKTIANLLNAIEPGIMPTYGSNVEDALTLAFELFQRSGYTQGDILLVTDGITAQALEQSSNLLKGKPFSLSIIGVGTEEGGPIPAGSGGFVKNEQGTIILPQLHAEQLMALAKRVNGHYSPLLLNDDDILPLVTGTQLLNQEKTKKTDREFDQWRDTGALLCFLLLPLVLASFRRGIIISLLFVLPLWHTEKAQALDANVSNEHFLSWDSLWLNDNQRALKAMQNKDYTNAAKHFTDPDWKASAQYEGGDYNSALKQFQTDHSDKGFYNQGNALAKSGKLTDAISAYNESLKKNPQFDDAAFNRKIVEELLQKQKDPKKEQEQQKNQDGGQGNQNQQTSKDDAQKNAKPGDKEQDKNSGEQQKMPSSNSENKPDQNSDQNRDEQQKAHQEKDKDKSDKDAKLDKGNSEQKKPEKQAEKSNAEEKPDTDNHASTELSPEQKQALEQWLRQVPDDPSGLLRNKFEYYYQQRLQAQQKGNTAKHLNNEERW